MHHPVDGSSALQPVPTAATPHLVTFAMLKANWNAGRSYLDNFVPFALEALREVGPSASPEDLQIELDRRFGMDIPQHAIEAIMGRACKDGYARRDSGVYTTLPDVLLPAATAAQNDFLRCHAAVVEGLRAFAHDTYGRSMDASEAGAGLEAYAGEFGTSIVVSGAVASRSFTAETQANPNLSFIIHAFVEHLEAADPAGFEYLAKVVEGTMLASVVYLPDLGAKNRGFRDSNAYLDTPFLLRLLGFHGPELQAPASELIRLLRRHGAGVACFDITLTELRGVLSSAAQQVGAGQAGRDDDIVAYFASQNMRRADVDLIVAGLEESLRTAGVRIVPRPKHNARSSIDEQELREVMARKVNYRREPTLVHDLDCLTAIDRLRDGHHQPILEHSRAVFVTTNTRLVAAARSYFRAEPSGSWPLAILDKDLATLLWLKEPLAAPALPRKQILANCYAALQPTPEHRARWADEIARTEAAGTYTPEQLELIRTWPDTQRTLMDVTLGDASSISERTVSEVLSTAEAALTAPVRAQLSAVQAELEDERALRAAAEDQPELETVAEQAAAEALRNDRKRRHGNLDRVARRRAELLGKTVRVLLVVVLVVATGMSFVGVAAVPGPSVPLAARIAAGLVAISGALLSVAGGAWGLDARSIGDRVESSAHPRLYRRALRRAGEDA